MSDTPRTEAAWKAQKVNKVGVDCSEAFNVSCQLESELTTAKYELKLEKVGCFHCEQRLAEAEKVISTAEAAMCQATFMVGAGNSSDLNHAIDKTRAFLFAIAQGEK